MPVSRRGSGVHDVTPEGPNHLRPYIHHGVQLDTRSGSNHAVGECPFCGKSKFSVEVATGLWRCLVCGAGTDRGGGNALVFLRLLHAASVRATPEAFLREVAADRRLLDPATVAAWGVCRSVVPPHPWLVPGYSPDGRLDQIYRRAWVREAGRPGGGSWRLLPTPGVWPEGRGHALHLPAGDYDTAGRSHFYVCEGPWDGMALWELSSRSEDVNTIAVPGCQQWRDDWSEMLRGKHVTLMYDSDHPVASALAQGRTVTPGYDGMVRVAKRLSGIAGSVRWLRWGPDGFDPTRPSGWDVRDEMSAWVTADERRTSLTRLLDKVQDAPADWSLPHTNGVAHYSGGSPEVEPESCDSWARCEAAWWNALEWRGELSDVMSVMLSVAASTNQAGDNQLFLQVIADPGSAKTRMCKGLLVSKSCKQLTHLKSFHSGWKQGNDSKDCSLVSRINGLCLVTPEADAVHQGMNAQQIDTQVRQIFDGDSGNTYGNSDEDRQYKGLRSPWIQAGTPALMDKDQSRLGDRFLRIRIEQPEQEVKRSIMLRALRNERQAVLETSNGTESSIIPPKLRRAYALTGGYVDWLRAHVEERIALVDMNPAAEERCCDMAELVADMRARPNMDPKKHEVHHTKELGSRLAGQLGRLSLCLAVVLNRCAVDAEVLRVVRKVTLDTAHGYTLNIAQWLASPEPNSGGRTYQEGGGLAPQVLAVWSGMTRERLENYMVFLCKIGVAQWRSRGVGGGAWALTDRVYDLYLRVIGG